MNIFLILIHLTQQSDTFTKIIVIVLLILTIFVLSCFIYNYFKIKKKINLAKEAISSINNNISFNDFKKQSQHFIHYLCTLNIPSNFTEDDIIHILHFAIQKYLTQEKQALQSFTITASLSPLIGLLGTVWGIIHAFMGIAQSGAGDLGSVAPGIAEALITTLAGLFVAIPSLYFYHKLNGYYKEYNNMIYLIGTFIARGICTYEK